MINLNQHTGIIIADDAADASVMKVRSCRPLTLSLSREGRGDAVVGVGSFDVDMDLPRYSAPTR
jgi:hypothetical protein